VRAGVGFLRVIDRDWVEESNLQRQVLFEESDARERRPKAEAAAAALRRIDRSVSLQAEVADLNPGNEAQLLGDVDLIMDGTDNFEARYLINDVAVRDGRPWIYCGAVGTEGMFMPVLPGKSACLRCLFPAPPPPGSSATCDTAGVLAPAVGAIASLAAAEALKLLLGREEAVTGGLVSLDVWEFGWHVFRVPRKADCRCCGLREFEFLRVAAAGHATTLCGRNAVQITPPRPTRLDLESMARTLTRSGRVTVGPYLLRLQLEEQELTLFRDGRAIVEGTQDPAVARAVYARYVGS
jgi:adenylyltransferase/sulfurtransferase